MGTMIQMRLAVACAFAVIAIAPVQARARRYLTRATANAGVVYKWDTASNYTVLHNFTGGADGGYPHAGVICDSAGIAERIVRART
jgi:hypothetical protein